MVIAVSSTDVTPSQTMNRTEFVGTKTGRIEPHPQAFINPMKPGHTIRPHFHNVAQYQVITKGDGSLGKRALRPYSLHYVDAFTGYGPVVAGPGAMDYMALRSWTDPGAIWLDKPDARLKMKPSPRRHWVGEIPQPGEGDLTALRGVETRPIFAMEPDGAGALYLRLGPNAKAAPFDARGSGGAFFLVSDGAVRVEGRTLPINSVIFIGADEAPYEIEAAETGAAGVILGFPPVSEHTKEVRQAQA